MLRLTQIGNSLPVSYPVDPTAQFSPGMVGQLKLHGNSIVCGVSDGTAPLGIIDDTRQTAFYAPSVDETVIEPAVGRMVGGKLVSVTDVKSELQNSNIMESSFVSNIRVILKPRNGVIVFPAGTELNFDADGDGISDSIRAIVSYTYQVPNVPGDDSTIGNGRITIWFQRMIFSTDQYEVNQRYPLNAPLFVSEAGLLTTRQPSEDHPTIAIVLAPPTARNTFLEVLYL
jgi:hypothetical protein